MLLLIDGSGERRLEPKHGRVSRGVTPDDFGTLESWCATPNKATLLANSACARGHQWGRRRGRRRQRDGHCRTWRRRRRRRNAARPTQTVRHRVHSGTPDRSCQRREGQRTRPRTVSDGGGPAPRTQQGNRAARAQSRSIGQEGGLHLRAVLHTAAGGKPPRTSGTRPSRCAPDHESRSVLQHSCRHAV